MSSPYFGIIEIDRIENEKISAATAEESVLAEDGVRFVHYPDCQQLTIWLPYYGREYGLMRLSNIGTGKVLEERPTADRLNGSIQILWDTLEIAPGSYCLEFHCNNGWQHRIFFKKYKKGFAPKPKAQAAPPVAAPSNEPIVYRDGTGKVLPDEDLLLRAEVMKKMADIFGRSLRYEGTYRAGSIFYVEAGLEIEFWHEMGGGDCMFYIDVPTTANWEARTKTPLARRDEILQFVAKTVQREQASGVPYKISEDSIIFYQH